MDMKNEWNISDRIVGIAVALIVVTGLIHLIGTPDNLQEATYKGILFLLNGIAGLVAAYGIYRGSKSWGWGLGAAVASGAFIMYILSRTIGLPIVGVDEEWLEPMGVLSLVVEGAFVLLAGFVFARNLRLPSQNSLAHQA